jgi:flagellar FliL protein
MEKQSSSNKGLISFIVILIVLIIAAATGAIWYLMQKEKPSSTVAQQQKSIKLNQTEKILSKIGPLYPLAPMRVNLKNQNGKDVYLKITLSLELNNKLLANELDAKNTEIRNKIILLLSSQSIESIASDIGKVKICNTIKNTLNTMLTDGKIRHVYIVNFVIE